MNRLIAWAACAFCACFSLVAASAFIVHPAEVAPLAIGAVWGVFALLFAMAARRAAS